MDVFKIPTDMPSSNSIEQTLYIRNEIESLIAAMVRINMRRESLGEEVYMAELARFFV